MLQYDIYSLKYDIFAKDYPIISLITIYLILNSKSSDK